MKAVKDFPKNWQETPFTLKVNGELRQSSSLSQANLNADAIIHYVDPFFPILDGDLIFTGTPAGVGPLLPEDEVELSFGPIHYKFKLVNKSEF